MKNRIVSGVAAVLVLAATLVFPSHGGAAVQADAIIGNGTVQLGINQEGHLNVDGGTPSAGEGQTMVGIRFMPNNHDAISPGCQCEGWGVSDGAAGVSGSANESTQVANLVVESFETTASTARSVVTVGSTFRVTHAYAPAPETPNLYRVDVTIENTSGATVNPWYRRNMDWDIEPTAFAEYVTIRGTGKAANVRFASNDGFADSDPQAGESDLGLTGDFEDQGPDDHGALFDFGFDPLAPGASVKFRTFYGAAENEDKAEAALAAVAAEVVSLGQPSTEHGPTSGTPNTFMFGFAGVGGAVLEPAVRFSDEDYTVREGEGPARIGVRLNGPADKDVTVEVVSADGTAVAPGDYDGADPQVTIAKGATEGTVSIPIVDDGAAEGDETVNLSLRPLTTGVRTAAPETATLTISDRAGTTSTTSTTVAGGGTTSTTVAGGGTSTTVAGGGTSTTVAGGGTTSSSTTVRAASGSSTTTTVRAAAAPTTTAPAQVGGTSFVARPGTLPRTGLSVLLLASIGLALLLSGRVMVRSR